MKVEKCVCGGESIQGTPIIVHCLNPKCHYRVIGHNTTDSSVMWNAAMRALKRKKVRRAK